MTGTEHNSSHPAVPPGLAALAAKARRLYAARVANTVLAASWWTAVILTASSKRQADRYKWEDPAAAGRAARFRPQLTWLHRPRRSGIGSGGATLNALRMLMSETLLKSGDQVDLAAWWSTQRVADDPRRRGFPPPAAVLALRKTLQRSAVATPWGETSTVFDEMMALSTAWVERLPSGLVVGSGDVILTLTRRK
jgi:hypothetical protein